MFPRPYSPWHQLCIKTPGHVLIRLGILCLNFAPKISGGFMSGLQIISEPPVCRRSYKLYGQKVLVIGPFRLLRSNIYFYFLIIWHKLYSDYLIKMSGKNESVIFLSQNGIFEVF